jgi:iron complex outermembrane recepter protein
MHKPAGTRLRVIPALLLAMTTAQAVTAQTVIEEIIVSAQKREDNLQDVPIAISAFSGAQLESRGIQNLGDLSSAAPSLLVMRGGGGNTAAVISMRGSTTANPALWTETTVGTYVDGVFMGKVLGSVTDILDLERVEVLRGPQGTLFGRNTLSGALNFVTKQPTGEFGGAATVDVGNYNSRVGKLSMDLPQVGIASVSFGLRKETRDGFVDTLRSSSVSEVDDVDNQSARLSALLQFTDDVSLDYRFDYTDVDQRPAYAQLYRANSFVPSSSALAHRERQTDAGIGPGGVHERLKITGHAVTLSWDINSDHTFKSITAMRKMDSNDRLDLDGTILQIGDTPRVSEYEQKSQEFQLAGQFGDLNYVTGVYGFTDEGDVYNPQTMMFGAVRTDQRYDFETKSYAGYGQVDWLATDELTLTAGLRYSKEKKEAGRSILNLNSGLYTVPLGTENDADFSATTGVLSAAYRISNAVNVYAKYSEGFKSGGINAEATTVADFAVPFKPEEVTAYELGIKTNFADGRAQLNAAVFRNEVTDMQLNRLVPSGSGTSIVVVNAGEATIQGVELEGVFIPFEGWRLQANYSWLDPEIEEFIDRHQGVVSDQADNRVLQRIAEHQLNVTLDAELLATEQGTLRAVADYIHTGAYYTSTAQRTSSGPNYDPTLAIAGDTKVKASDFVNMRLIFEDIPLGHEGRGEVSLWIRNLTDEEHINNYINFGPSFGNMITATWDEPRTYGAAFTYRW